MAVSHGYSKITTSGSVFAYDLGDTFNSYKGEPTTNILIPFPTATTLPSTMFFGYEYSCSIENAPVLGTPFDNEKWVKFVKTSAVNGRATFLNVGGLIAGGDYTWTAYTYINDSRNTSLTMGSDNTNNSVTISNIPYNFSRLGTLQRVTNTFRSVSGGQTQGVRGGAGDAIGSTFYMTGFQLEYKNYATQLVSGTRSISGSVIDIAANASTMVMTNMTYNNQAYPVFLPASSSRIAVDTNSLVNITGSEITLEQILYKTDTVTATPVHKEVQYTLQINGSGGISYADSSLWSYATFGYHGTALTSNIYHHLVAVKRADTTVAIYVDGKLIISKTFGGAITSTANQLIIGAYAGTSQFFSGLIPVTRLYNRALTEGEILDNYSHYKTRFNLP